VTAMIGTTGKPFSRSKARIRWELSRPLITLKQEKQANRKQSAPACEGAVRMRADGLYTDGMFTSLRMRSKCRLACQLGGAAGAAVLGGSRP
jgi:hypothetical protein